MSPNFLGLFFIDNIMVNLIVTLGKKKILQ